MQEPDLSSSFPFPCRDILRLATTTIPTQYTQWRATRGMSLPQPPVAKLQGKSSPQGLLRRPRRTMRSSTPHRPRRTPSLQARARTPRARNSLPPSPTHSRPSVYRTSPRCTCTHACASRCSWVSEPGLESAACGAFLEVSSLALPPNIASHFLPVLRKSGRIFQLTRIF
jgi:hypothetical protein